MKYIQEEITAAIEALDKPNQKIVDFADDLSANSRFMELVEEFVRQRGIPTRTVAPILHVGIVLGIELEKNRKVAA